MNKIPYDLNRAYKQYLPLNYKEVFSALVLSKEKSLHLEDNIGSNIQFQRDTTPDVTDYYGYMYWAYVEDFGDNYEITVTGETTAIDFKG